jgi:hypothetical protein
VGGGGRTIGGDVAAGEGGKMKPHKKALACGEGKKRIPTRRLYTSSRARARISKPLDFAEIEPAPVGAVLRSHLLREEMLLRLALAELVDGPLLLYPSDSLYCPALRLVLLGIADGEVLDGKVKISLPEVKRGEVAALLRWEVGRSLLDRRRS